MKDRVSAIIIKDKKILLSKDDWADFFSTPGGMVEKGEDLEKALDRELKEELGVSLGESKLIFHYEALNGNFNAMQKNHNHLTTIIGTPKPLAEIKEIRWFSKEEILSGEVKILDHFLNESMPKLIEKDLL